MTAWRWTLRPVPPAQSRRFRQFHLDTKGRIIGVTMRTATGTGINVPCTAPLFHPGVRQPGQTLVRLIVPNGPRNGWLVNANYAHKED